MWYDELPAGSEMDAAVGQYVFGHQILGMAECAPCYDGGGYLIPYDGDAGEHAVKRPVYLAHCSCEVREECDADFFGHISGCLDIADEYSSEIEAAWQVVEKLAEARIVISLMDQLGYEDEVTDGVAYLKQDMLWRVMFMSLDAHERDAPRAQIWFPIGEAPSAPLAICRAGLNALENKLR